MLTLLLDICWMEVTQGYFREMWVQGSLQLCHTGRCLHPTCVCVCPKCRQQHCGTPERLLVIFHWDIHW